MPMERSRYPKNWSLLAIAIKDAASWCCQQCGKPCCKPGEAVTEFEKRLDTRWLTDLVSFISELGQAEVALYRPKRFLLTVAHLDQDPSNNEPENLKALCAPCHLRYDRRFQAFNRRTKLERQGQLRHWVREDGQP
jgi:5-methylcytosine-specific restriction endonuclease McrA